MPTKKITDSDRAKTPKETHFSSCGHTARLPQTTTPPTCPKGCDSGIASLHWGR